MTNPTPHGQVPEALRLAISIDLMDTFTDYQQEELNKAAAELSRLHAENERLSGLCDKWNSECDEFREDNKRLAALVEAQQHTRIAELEAARFAYASEFDPNGDGYPDVGSIHANIRAMKAKLASIGAVGVQAFSAAPAVDIATVGEAQAFEAWYKQDCVIEGAAAKMAAKAAWKARAMLAASPTPPAEQQTTPKAAPVVWLSSKQLRGVTALHGQYLPFRRQPEGRFDTPVYLVEAAPKAAPSGPDYSEKWDAELGRTAMRFVDRAGDVHPGIDDAETICAEFHNAMSEVIAQMPRVQRMAAPQQEAQEPCGWDGAEEWEKLAWHLCAEENGEDACNDLIWEGGPIPEPWGDRWLKYEDEARRMIALVRTHVPAPQPAPAPRSDSRITAIEQAIRDYHYALDCRQHGGIAGVQAFGAICNAMQMHWVQGQESTRRAALAAQGGE